MSVSPRGGIIDPVLCSNGFGYLARKETRHVLCRNGCAQGSYRAGRLRSSSRAAAPASAGDHADDAGRPGVGAEAAGRSVQGGLRGRPAGAVGRSDRPAAGHRGTGRQSQPHYLALPRRPQERFDRRPQAGHALVPRSTPSRASAAGRSVELAEPDQLPSRPHQAPHDGEEPGPLHPAGRDAALSAQESVDAPRSGLVEGTAAGSHSRGHGPTIIE